MEMIDRMIFKSSAIHPPVHPFSDPLILSRVAGVLEAQLFHPIKASHRIFCTFYYPRLQLLHLSLPQKAQIEVEE